MTNTISAAEFTRLMDGIARAVTAVTYAYTEVEPAVEYVEAVTRKIALDYLDELGIEEVEDEEEEEPDFPDDVDETNYNPYMGCDDYECYTYDDLGADWY